MVTVAVAGLGTNDASASGLTQIILVFVNVLVHPFASVTVKATLKHPPEVKFAELVGSDVAVCPLPKFQSALTDPGVAFVKVTCNGAQPDKLSAEKATAGAAFTTMVVVEGPEQDPGISYVITCDPTPATAGSNDPFAAFTIPVPDQLPPGLTDVSKTIVPFSQKGPAALIAVEFPGFSVTFVVADAEQEFAVRVTVYVPKSAPVTDAILGF